MAGRGEEALPGGHGGVRSLYLGPGGVERTSWTAESGRESPQEGQEG